MTATVLRRLSPLLAAALAFLAFLPALGAQFVNWDDEVSFLRNPDYRGLGSAQIRWMLTTTLLGHWSPLTWMTWSVNHVLGGLDPWGYHLGNLLLHATTVALLCLVARRLLAAGFGLPPARPAIAAGAFVAALVFGLHPLRAESVAWVSERRDVLCGLFYLLAVQAYLRGVAGGARVEGRWCALSVGAFAAALLSKAIAVTLPLTLLLMDVYPLRRRALGWRARVTEKLPYALLAAGAAALAVVARQEGGNITAYDQYGVGARIALAGYTFWFYPWKLVWPAGLSPMYELPARIGPGQWRFLGPLVAVAIITTVLVALRRRWPAGLAVWVSSAIVLSPISGAVHSGSQLAADRYSYLSGLGFAVLAGAAVPWIARRVRRDAARGWVRPLVWGAATLTLGALWLGAWKQTAIWRSSETLWQRAVDEDPACSICESNLGRVMARPGRFAEAEAHVRRAVALRPDRHGPYENMGAIMLAQGRYREAEEHFRRVVMLRPGHGGSRNNLGVALANQGRDAEAEAEFREAARLSARLVDAPANLGALYVRQGRYEEAIAPLRRAAALDAGRVAIRANLGRALVERGRAMEAIPSLEQAVALDPRGAQERFWLVRAYRLAGRPADADRETAALRELAPALAAELTR